MKTTIYLLFVILLAPPALGAITTYSFDPITNYRIYPHDEHLTVEESNLISVRTCPGEYIASTFVVRTTEVLDSFLPVPSPLAGSSGTIPSANVDIKIVKCWYQRGDDIVNPDGTRLYLPELLLNDNELIQVDYVDMTHGNNYLRTTTGYVSINSPGEGGEFLQVYDSPTLLPLSIEQNQNQQFWVTFYIPVGTPPGVYNGVISLENNGEEIGVVQTKIEVLPFTLPPSPIVFAISRPNNPLDISLYYTSRKYNNTPSLGSYGRSEEQLHAEFKDLKKHGVTNPNIGCQSYYNNAENFMTYLQIRQQEGMNFGTIYHTADTIEPGSYLSTLTLINTRVPELLGIYEDFGAEEVYFYCDDEDDVVYLANLILAIHDLGGKTMDAQSPAEALSAANYIDPETSENHPLLNQASTGGTPLPTLIKHYHDKGLKYASYGNPQCGEEKPLLYRQNYGLMLWQYDLDQSGTFAYCYSNYLQGYRNNWNDWNWETTTDYKAEVFAYPTSNGVVDTIQWEGFREGVNDLRYVAKLEQTILEAKALGIDTAGAESYLSDLKKTTNPISQRDLAEVRNDLIEFILDPGKSNETPGFLLPLFLLAVLVSLKVKKWKK